MAARRAAKGISIAVTLHQITVPGITRQGHQSNHGNENRGGIYCVGGETVHKVYKPADIAAQAKREDGTWETAISAAAK